MLHYVLWFFILCYIPTLPFYLTLYTHFTLPLPYALPFITTTTCLAYSILPYAVVICTGCRFTRCYVFTFCWLPFCLYTTRAFSRARTFSSCRFGSTPLLTLRARIPYAAAKQLPCHARVATCGSRYQRIAQHLLRITFTTCGSFTRCLAAQRRVCGWDHVVGSLPFTFAVICHTTLPVLPFGSLYLPPPPQFAGYFYFAVLPTTTPCVPPSCRVHFCGSLLRHFLVYFAARSSRRRTRFRSFVATICNAALAFCLPLCPYPLTFYLPLPCLGCSAFFLPRVAVVPPYIACLCLPHTLYAPFTFALLLACFTLHLLYVGSCLCPYHTHTTTCALLVHLLPLLPHIT